MANKSISQLDSASTLQGTDLIEIASDQGSSTYASKSTTLGALSDFIGGKFPHYTLFGAPFVYLCTKSGVVITENGRSMTTSTTNPLIISKVKTAAGYWSYIVFSLYQLVQNTDYTATEYGQLNYSTITGLTIGGQTLYAGVMEGAWGQEYNVSVNDGRWNYNIGNTNYFYEADIIASNPVIVDIFNLLKQNS